MVDLPKLESLFAQLERQGVTYKLGAKANQLHDAPSAIEQLDCSGFVRYALAQASTFDLILPDGSQNQREFVENLGWHKLKQYSDANTYGTSSRLFICFIKPGANGCGPVGHVWMVTKLQGDNTADTMECYGGHGVGSRTWNSRPLAREVYSVFEVPLTSQKV